MAEELIKLQLDRLEHLKRIAKNFKKDSAARKTKTYLEYRLARIAELFSRFTTDHDKIVTAANTTEHEYFTTQVPAQFEDLHLELLCAIHDIFPTSNTPSTEAKATSSAPAESVSKLPTLPVPTFTGKLIDWPGFHDTFKRLIHCNQELSSIEKFHYLKKALISDQDFDLQQMPLTETNYQSAWTLLLKRYDNPRVLFAHHMNTLYNLPIQHKERSDELKRMLNMANLCVNEFTRLNIPIFDCSQWLAHYLSTKFSKDTYQHWEVFLGDSTEIPTFKNFESFVNQRIIMIDMVENRHTAFNIERKAKSSPDSSHHSYVKNTSHKSPKNETKFFHAVTRNETSQKADTCVLCMDKHIIRRCPTFLSMDCFSRKATADKYKLCLNCLSKNHVASRCSSSKNCLQCGHRHHTLFHFPSNVGGSHSTSVIQSSETPGPPTTQIYRNADTITTNLATTERSVFAATTEHGTRGVLLATAMVTLVNMESGNSDVLRALIDPGSEGTIITEHAAQLLALPRRPTSAEISGVGQNNPSRCRSLTSFILRSPNNNNFEVYVDSAYILSSLTSKLPTKYISPQNWPHLDGLVLADSFYYLPRHIDLILGADIIPQILMSETRVGSLNQPMAQRTQFGWILTGRAEPFNSNIPSISIQCNHTAIELESLVHKFYELEHISETRPMSDENKWCEEFFRTTHQRQENGKYLVRLPLKSIYDPNQTLGRSRQMALNRFHKLERHFTADPNFGRRYVDCINEYFSLDQIMPAQTSEDTHAVFTATNKPTLTACFLPHHAVIKDSDTKIRVVFDASAKTTNGRSLNELLCIGPPLQNDLAAVILNWRLHKYVITADIQKMYRCIDMHPEDSQYQRILWRKDNIIQTFCLTTVTFGTASAPFTAIRTLHQLANEERHRFPLAEHILKNETHVDYILTASFTANSFPLMYTKLSKH